MKSAIITTLQLVKITCNTYGYYAVLRFFNTLQFEEFVLVTTGLESSRQSYLKKRIEVNSKT
ncbi:hypothetical protein [Flavobacterium marginilacus]|uniref:hypothetical protein n=1 Tax=Flavobacterium marginilacus TaxID=3003256 RepID=UPI00248D9843|nr:hypothetical protein [Flavobacterium marginilacus]